MEPSASGEPMSLGARLVNVFAAPGELFAAVAAAPFSIANWLVPTAIVGLIGLIANLVIFGQPALMQQVVEAQDRELQKRVESGKIRAEDAERAKEVMRGIGMTVMRVAGGVGAVVAALLTPLWWGWLAWMVARWVFRAPLPYLRAVEVAALAGLIGAVGTLVAVFLAVGLGRLFAGPHLGMLVTDFDMTRRLHLAMGAVNFFSLWQMLLVAMGMARLMGRPWVPVAVVWMGVWAGYKAIAVILGLAQFAL